MGRATAIVLFTDLVGSTELRSRLGEEAAEELRRNHDRLLSQAVEANAGRVVKGLGDGIMATFSGASDAVAAAMAIQQAVDRLNRSAKAVAALEVRVGISAGDVTMENDDVHGTPVIEAARLCGVATGGQILASEMVRWLARSSAAGAFSAVGNLELKGLPEPVPAVRVEWEPLAASTIPMPALLTDMGRIFVGRDAELERLTQLWKEAAAGERRVALIAGEPGVGKTRLAAEVALRVHGEGATVLAGRCDEDLGVPYQPFVEALRHHVAHATELKLGRHAGELVRLLPDLAEVAVDLPPPLRSDPETERYRLFDAVAAWLAAASADEPVLLVLDDLQWAAKPTLLLLRHVVRSLEPKGVLVVVTYRDTELGHGHPLIEVLADLRRQGGMERISLSGLDSSGVAAFMEEAAGHELDEDHVALARAIHEETEGNPFFVREVFRHLSETGAIDRREGRWTTRLPVEELGIPESVRDVIGRRLSRLSEAANQTLRMAAVVGAEFELPVLQVAGSLDEEPLLSCLEEATEARLVMEAAEVAHRYRFPHALVRDTLYGQLSAARRVALHRHVAEAIEAVHGARLDDHLPALAHHWARASASEAERAKAVDYATRAGDRALAQLAHDEAVNYYCQALELLDVAPGDESRRRLELQISLGEAQRRAGDPAHRDTLLAAGRLARDLGNADGCARAALANQRGQYSRFEAVDLERVAALEEALDVIGPSETPVRARLLASLACELYFADDDRRHAVAGEALTIARRLGDPATLTQVLTAAWYATWDPAGLEKRARLVDELAELARRLGDHVLEFHAGLALFLTAMQQGDMQRADAGLEACSNLAEELGQPVLRWQVLYTRANRAMAAGRFDEVEHLAEEALRLGEAAGQPAAVVYHYAALGTIRALRGDFEEALPMVERFAGMIVHFRAALAWLYAELDRPKEARAVVEDLRKENFAGIPRDHAWLVPLSFLSRACARLDESEPAAELYALLRPYCFEMVVVPTLWIGPVAHDLGLLATTIGRYDDADSYFAAATEVQELIGARATLPTTQLEWARMLLTRRQPGDAERTHELLVEALNTARELGLASVERRAVALLEDCP